MEVDEPSLADQIQERIESVRLARISGKKNHNGSGFGSRRETVQDGYHDREMSDASTATLRNMPQSRELTATMMGMSEPLHPPEGLDDAMHIDPPETGQPSREQVKEPTVIVATDFGTTFSSVAFALREDGRRPRVRMVASYPDDPGHFQGRPNLEVPTESWYPTAARQDAVELFTKLNDEQEVDASDASDQEDDEPESDDEPIEERDIMEASPPRNPSQDFKWGYGIRKEIAPDMDLKKFDRIARSKLMLDTSKHTQQVRDDLRPVIKRLRRRQLIRQDEDVIADYLTQLFIHAKKQIHDSLEISDATPIEHVLCVPIIWSSKALRTMQWAMERAILSSGLGKMENLFLVSEPEAAAAYVLGRSDEVNAREAFLILDAGGGTVDCTTYMVDKPHPLRLSKELVESEGCLHGSSFLNEDFRKYLLNRLGDEKYLEQNDYTIEGLVDTEMITFEKETKRTLDVNDKNMPIAKIQIQGLKADDKKGFGHNRMFVTRNDFYKIFIPHLKEIGNLMEDQLSRASKAGFRVQKVVLIGGFSGSISLRNYLKRELKLIGRTEGYHIKLIDTVGTGAPETAVAHGAVLRALNKEDGPARITRSSYGFLRSEPFGEYLEHAGVRPHIDKLDGFRYVDRTIDWLVKKGSQVLFHKEYCITAYHIFNIDRKYFKCEEILYVSDTCNESHYRATHVKNKGKVEIVGKIIADMSFLVNEGKIEPIEPDPRYAGKPHYKIEFELVMIVDGRNLRYEARWPVGGEVRSGGQISIAAAFQLGTN